MILKNFKFLRETRCQGLPSCNNSMYRAFLVRNRVGGYILLFCSYNKDSSGHTGRAAPRRYSLARTSTQALAPLHPETGKASRLPLRHHLRWKAPLPANFQQSVLANNPWRTSEPQLKVKVLASLLWFL